MSESVFSDSFEKNLILIVDTHLRERVEIEKRNLDRPKWIRQKDLSLYFSNISRSTLTIWESKGLKRSEPVEGGGVYYSASELDYFMEKYSY